MARHRMSPLLRKLTKALQDEAMLGNMCQCIEFEFKATNNPDHCSVLGWAFLNAKEDGGKPVISCSLHLVEHGDFVSIFWLYDHNGKLIKNLSQGDALGTITVTTNARAVWAIIQAFKYKTAQVNLVGPKPK